jgi:hypothetical protein
VQAQNKKSAVDVKRFKKTTALFYYQSTTLFSFL